MCCIPNEQDPEEYTKAEFINEQFVEISSDEHFDVKMQYSALGMKNAENLCLVRERVYHRLKKAQENLPKGYRFRIWDAWRPFNLQEELYYSYSERIIKQFGLENESKAYKASYIKKFVSEPVKNINIPPVHTTGGAVDLTIIDSDNNELDMGTYFDEFTEKTRTAYFEDKNEIKVTNNRRMLYNAMTNAGFTNLPSEWWHYDYGDRFWAFYNDKPAIYKGTFDKGDIIYGCKEECFRGQKECNKENL